VSQLLKILRPGGQALIYVWAVEQERNKVKSKYLKKAEHGQQEIETTKLCSNSETASENAEQVSCSNDSMDTACKSNKGEETEEAHRQADSKHNGESSSKRLEVHVNRTHFKQQDVLVPWQLKKAGSDGDSGDQPGVTYHRFYHVFQQGELEQLCLSVGNCRIVKSNYDQGNWTVILEKL